MAAEKYVLITVPSNDMIGTEQFSSYEAACTEMLSQLGQCYAEAGGEANEFMALSSNQVFEGERLGFWIDDPETANACFKRADGTSVRWVIEKVTFEVGKE